LALDVPDETAPSSRSIQALKDVDMKGKLHGVMPLWFPIVLVIPTVLASPGFDVARDVAAGLFAQQVGHADQVFGTYLATINEGLATRHGFEREALTLDVVRLGEIKERKPQPGDCLALEKRAAFP
jgi:hypothetical protein